MSFFSRSVITVCLIFCSQYSYAKIFHFNDGGQTTIIGNYADELVDTSGKLTFDQVRNSTAFIQSKDRVPNFGITSATIWLKLQIANDTKEPDVFLLLGYPVLDHVELYSVKSDASYSIDVTGEEQAISDRKYHNQDFFFNLGIKPGETNTYYIKIQSTEQILAPLTIGTNDAVFASVDKQDILTGLYCGIILVMVFYNLFVYFSVRDKSYLYYVLYILFVGFTQISLQGYSYRLLWPSMPWIANQSVIIFPALTGIAAIEFFKYFLHVRQYSRVYIWILNALNVFYVVNCLLSLFGDHRLSQQLLQPNALLASLVIVFMTIRLLQNGSRSARFFLLAWITFLVGIVIFVLKDVGVIPYNNFTNYILHIGSAIEVIVLSLALADSINIFRKEKEESQAQTLIALQENEKMIREQNIVLEAKVTERTVELKSTNQELNKTLKDLKEAESHLVESEKMASLGQLTAGIAHEINNPINFVTSNVKPLKRDVEMLLEVVQTMEDVNLSDASLADKQKQIDEYKADIDFDYLKQEITQLLDGISDGASRTAEIVKGLRIFSRLDEDDLKKADINDGLDSTLVITNSLMNNRIEVVKKYSNLPLVECYPGKLNQVFLNIISNAIYAINKRYGEQNGGKLTITTLQNEDKVVIKIADNGIGMDEKTQKKLFEPFFTTKEVGEGTGLGLSIVYNTIVKHSGSISLKSTLGEGTEFTIELPVNH